MYNNILRTSANWLMVAMFTAMIILVFGNVVLRYAFSSGISFSEEVSRFLFIWLTLIGALLVMKDHAHLGVSTLVARLNETGQRICRFSADALSLACCSLLVYGGWKQVLITMDDHAPVTGIPMGLVYSSILISSIGMAAVFAHSLWRQISGRMPKDELVPNSGASGE
jgi:TRAP-type C4-dicarboxylate transport system permease small subunit